MTLEACVNYSDIGNILGTTACSLVVCDQDIPGHLANAITQSIFDRYHEDIVS